MRLLALCIVVLCAFMVFVVVTIIDGRTPDTFEPHAPDSADERAAAEVAVRYAQATQRDDMREACGFAAGTLARELKCADRPRTQRCEGSAVHHIEEDGDAFEVRLQECWLRVAERPEGWRVVERVGIPGYA